MDLFGIKLREDAELMRHWEEMMTRYREGRGDENPGVANPWLIQYPNSAKVQRNYDRFLSRFDHTTGEYKAGRVMVTDKQIVDAIEEANAAQLRGALRHALSIIHNYQSDIRDSKWVGVDLVKRGFCQGVIYQHAYDDILRRLKERA